MVPLTSLLKRRGASSQPLRIEKHVPDDLELLRENLVREYGPKANKFLAMLAETLEEGKLQCSGPYDFGEDEDPCWSLIVQLGSKDAWQDRAKYIQKLIGEWPSPEKPCCASLAKHVKPPFSSDMDVFKGAFNKKTAHEVIAGETEPEDIDVNLAMVFASSYGETGPTCEEGVTFRIDIVEHGGRILGGCCPDNYTDACWVDANDKEAVEKRWQQLIPAEDKYYVAGEQQANEIVCLLEQHRKDFQDQVH